MGEVDRMLAKALDGARQLLIDERPLLDAIGAELLAEDTADLDRLNELWAATKTDAEAAAELDASASRRHPAKAGVLSFLPDWGGGPTSTAAGCRSGAEAGARRHKLSSREDRHGGSRTDGRQHGRAPAARRA